MVTSSKSRLGGWLVLLGVVAWLTGCSSGTETVTVSGTVTMGGQPVAGAAITLAPKEGPPVTAVTDDSGKFTVQAPPGTYQVAIAKTETVSAGAAQGGQEEPPDVADDDEGSAEIRYLTPSKYASPVTSGLTLEVKPGMGPVQWELTAEGAARRRPSEAAGGQSSR